MIIILLATILLIVLFLLWSNKQSIPVSDKALHLFWRDKVVVVTGGASGIGRDICLQLAALGSQLVVFDVSPEALKAIENEIKQGGGRIDTLITDVADKHQVQESMKQAHMIAGRKEGNSRAVDVVIANAGIVFAKKLLDLEHEHIQRTIDVNLLSHFWIAKAALPLMKQRGMIVVPTMLTFIEGKGHLVFVSSVAALVGMSNLTDYCARFVSVWSSSDSHSKFGSFGFAESLRRELWSEPGIHVTTVCPWAVSTGMFSGMGKVVLPMITSHHVATSVVHAVCNGDGVLYVPWFMRYAAISHLLPEGMMDWMAYLTNAMEAGSTVVGRGVLSNMNVQT
ncbi:short-chain dehydrogenase/reductase family 16C member 6-like [Planoprotostelium fungivorum]|uniref:Short-chain dehydrogenase/reductase family 16C member 6-like n=1 Tax=Planoprotostelium fungivorum TaxID=1890364 RepID=A0A2P6MVZ6_9EUKA|nr:short-chain dehydrogenase/reductase family 16C member 6-like [Planoprotostelium fungivorum]